MSTKVRITVEADTTTIEVHGDVTGETDFSEAAKVETSQIVFDLASLERLNSRGIVHWMKLLNALCERCDKIDIVNAPHAFMSPYSMIEGMSAAAVVQSIAAEYVCPDCERVQLMTLEREAHFPEGRFVSEPAPACEKCGGPTVPDHPYFDSNLQL